MTVATEVLNELNFRRRSQHLWNCGPRAVAELLAEIGSERNITTLIDDKLTRYSKLSPLTLKALGADRMPPAPLHLVCGRGK